MSSNLSSITVSAEMDVWPAPLLLVAAGDVVIFSGDRVEGPALAEDVAVAAVECFMEAGTKGTEAGLRFEDLTSVHLDGNA